jgi:phosphate transport system substrate-binding protein
MKMTVAIAGGVFAATATAALAETRGSGASFPRLAYQTWCQESGGLCSYVSKGSTGGINDFIAGLTDFGASDAPLTDAQRAQLAAQRGGSGVVYFPTLLGAVTVPTNVAGQPGRLQLRAKTIGQIFAGVITSWSDPRIRADNATNKAVKGFRFPNQPIIACVRSDGSGTSFAFTQFLQKASTDFRSRVGRASQLPNWKAPNIIKANGNTGVASCVNSNSGAIGYVDLGDARNAGLGPRLAAVGKSEVIRVKRRIRGRVQTVSIRRLIFMPPSVPAIQRAGNLTSSQIPSNLLIDLTLSPAKAAYPIVTTTWVLGYTNFAAAGKAGSVAGVKSTLNYFYSSRAQSRLSSLGFAPLPPALLTKAKAQLTKLK